MPPDRAARNAAILSAHSAGATIPQIAASLELDPALVARVTRKPRATLFLTRPPPRRRRQRSWRTPTLPRPASLIIPGSPTRTRPAAREQIAP
jgi:hypothetical protein